MYVGMDLRENLRQPDGAHRFSRKFRRKRNLHLLVKRKKSRKLRLRLRLRLRVDLRPLVKLAQER